MTSDWMKKMAQDFLSQLCCIVIQNQNFFHIYEKPLLQTY